MQWDQILFEIEVDSYIILIFHKISNYNEDGKFEQYLVKFKGCTHFNGILLQKSFENVLKMCKLNDYGSFETHFKFSSFDYLVSVGLNKINYQVPYRRHH